MGRGGEERAKSVKIGPNRAAARKSGKKRGKAVKSVQKAIISGTVPPPNPHPQILNTPRGRRISHRVSNSPHYENFIGTEIGALGWWLPGSCRRAQTICARAREHASRQLVHTLFSLHVVVKCSPCRARSTDFPICSRNHLVAHSILLMERTARPVGLW